jgi:methylphosphotriester-DNA--protein-cysteine methyltransferase
MTDAETTVQRTIPIAPIYLRKQARKAGFADAREFLINVLATTPTLTEAADQLGVSRETLRRYRKRLKIRLQ